MVERPASVVKELLENAIDAQSSRIDIDIERGGSTLIRVRDNGSGVNRDDLALAVTRHATSKLHTLTELEQMNSLGFRGEALASISAVSRLSIQSKQAEQEQAWMIDTGTDSDFANYSAIPEPVAHPAGTTIDVRDLFYNTPARRKFMRTVKTEFKHIDDIVKRIALSQFNIAFKLTHNKKILRNLPKAVTEKAIKQRISKLFSAEFLTQTQRVDFTSNHFSNMGEIRLWGWVSLPQWHRNQPDWQYFYVNGRYIKDKLVNHAMRQAYQEQLPTDTFSAYILYLEINPQQVDVNVHPTKHEVRFRQTRLVHDFIYSALKQAICPELPMQAKEAAAGVDQATQEEIAHLNRFTMAHSNQYTSAQSLKENGRYYPGNEKPSTTGNYPTHSPSFSSKNNVAEHLDGLHKLYQTETSGNNQSNSLETSAGTDKSQILFGHPVECLFSSYLLSQNELHAVAEPTEQKQLFLIHITRAQQFLLSRLFRPGEQVPLLIPLSVTLTVEAIEHFLQHQAELREWGLDVSQLAADTLMLRSLPSLYGIPGCQIESETLLRRILKIIAIESTDQPKNKSTDLLAALTESISTHNLDKAQQEKLLSLLSEQINTHESKKALMNKQTIWVKLDQSALERLFPFN